jgi:hypothetical protein
MSISQRLGLALITSAGLLSVNANAALDLIRIDMSEGCPAAIVDDEPRDNGRCAGDAACRRPGESVRWEITGGAQEQFSVNFADTSLFANWNQGLCRATSGNAQRIQCQISQDAPIDAEYYYDVSVGSCLVDPKIIINR